MSKLLRLVWKLFCGLCGIAVALCAAVAVLDRLGLLGGRIALDIGPVSIRAGECFSGDEEAADAEDSEWV